MAITRVGIVAKARLQAAAEHLVQAAGWLQARSIEVCFDPDSAALASAAGAAGRVNRHAPERRLSEHEYVGA